MGLAMAAFHLVDREGRYRVTRTVSWARQEGKSVKGLALIAANEIVCGFWINVSLPFFPLDIVASSFISANSILIGCAVLFFFYIPFSSFLHPKFSWEIIHWTRLVSALMRLNNLTISLHFDKVWKQTLEEKFDKLYWDADTTIEKNHPQSDCSWKAEIKLKSRYCEEAWHSLSFTVLLFYSKSNEITEIENLFVVSSEEASIPICSDRGNMIKW